MSHKLNSVILHNIETNVDQLKVTTEITRRFGGIIDIEMVDAEKFLADGYQNKDIDLLILYLNNDICQPNILEYLSNLLNNNEQINSDLCPIVIDPLTELSKRDLSFLLSEIHVYPNSESSISQFSGYGLYSVISQIILFIESRYNQFLKEESDYEKIASSNDDYKINLCKSYLSTTIFRRHRREVEQIYNNLLAQLSDSQLWKRATELNTIESYNIYIESSLPKKLHEMDAAEAIKSLQKSITDIFKERKSNDISDLCNIGEQIIDIDIDSDYINVIKTEIESLLIAKYNSINKRDIELLLEFKSLFEKINKVLISYGAKRYYDLAKRISDKLINKQKIDKYKQFSDLSIASIEQGDISALQQYIIDNPDSIYIDDAKKTIDKIDITNAPIAARWRKFRYKKSLIVSLSIASLLVAVVMFINSIQLDLASNRIDTVVDLSEIQEYYNPTYDDKTLYKIVEEKGVRYSKRIAPIIKNYLSGAISEEQFIDKLEPLTTFDGDAAYLVGYKNQIERNKDKAIKLYEKAVKLGDIRSLRSLFNYKEYDNRDDAIERYALEFCRRDTTIYDGSMLDALLKHSSKIDKDELFKITEAYYNHYKLEDEVDIYIQEIFCFNLLDGILRAKVDKNCIKYLDLLRDDLKYWSLAQLRHFNDTTVQISTKRSLEYYDKAIEATKIDKLKARLLFERSILSNYNPTGKILGRFNLAEINKQQLFDLKESCRLGSRESANILGNYYAEKKNNNIDEAVKYFEFAMTSDSVNQSSTWARYNLGSLYYYGRIFKNLSTFPHDKRRGEELLRGCEGEAKDPALLILSNDIWWNKYDKWLW